MGTPANIVFGGATVTIGSDIGYIKDGVAISWSIDLYQVEGIEGLLTSPVARRTKEQPTVAFTTIEPTLANMKLVWDITHATAGGAPAPVTLKFGGDSSTPQSRVIVVTGVVPGGVFVRSIQFDVCVLSAPGEMTITQYGEVSVQSSYVALYDTTNTRLGRFSDVTA